ncbi:caspase family protein [Phanerochaete sordida]|uniref:Caspase family protein n=1 Tax=Phanerochaete sordida TaxID=48140 RepID=A0A9P3FY85_9APHY|nr:caspase family protein [Phanerochaete sordida]
MPVAQCSCTPGQPCPMPHTPPPFVVEGRRRVRALAIGIEYKPSRAGVGELNYIIRDLENFRDYVVREVGWPAEAVTIMHDGNDNPSLEPTRDNILTQIDLFVKDVLPGDYLIFLLLGHGCQTVNKTGTEDDNMDEAFLASNHAGWPTTSPNSTDKLNTPGPDDRRRGSPHCDTYRGIVLDNELRERLVNPLPAGAELLAFIETCHSGTMLGGSHPASLTFHTLICVDLQSKRWKRDPFTEVLAKLSATYSQFVDGIRRTRFSRLTSLDFTADPMDMITKPAKVRARSSAQKRGESYDQNYFLKSKRDYDFGDPWAVSFSATKDGKASMNNEHTMISVVIECLRAQRNARRQTTVLQLKKLVFDRLVDLRLQMLIAGNGGVEEPKWEKQLKKRLEPQVTALYPDALRYTAIQI